MGDILYCEWLKWKRSKMALIGFLGTLIVPVLVTVMSVQRHLAAPKRYQVWLFDLYDSALMFLMLLFAPLVLAILAAHLISREYTEKALKTMFSVPVSRGKFLAGKFLMLFLLVTAFMFVSWLEVLVFGVVCNILFAVGKITPASVVFPLFRMLKGGIFLYVETLPLFYLAMRTKGVVVPFGATAVVCILNVVLSGSGAAGIYPWTAAWLSASGRSVTGASQAAGYLVLAFMGVVAVFASVVWFLREDL